MTKFSPSDLALSGFRIIRGRPALLGWWALPHVVFVLVISLLMVLLMGPAFMQLQALQAQGPATTPEAQAKVFAALHGMLPMYALMIPSMLALYAVCFSAVNRAVLKPADRAYGYLRIGADELRQALLFLWAMVLGLAAYIAFFIVAIIVGVIVGLLAAASHQASGWIVGLLIAVGVLAYLGGYIYLLVRLSLGSALTFDTGRLQLLSSWRLTKGRFWPMLGAYLLAFLFNLLLMLGGLVVMALLSFATGGGFSVFSAHPDMSSPTAYFTISRVLSLVIWAVLYAVMLPVMIGPAAAIYQVLTTPQKIEPTSAMPASSPWT